LAEPQDIRLKKVYPPLLASSISGGPERLNHARDRMEATYDVHDYIVEKREALGKWAKYLEELCHGQGSI